MAPPPAPYPPPYPTTPYPQWSSPPFAAPMPVEEEGDRFTFKLWASGGARLIWDSPTYAFEGDLSFGGRLRRKQWYFYGVLGFSRGATSYGLDVSRIWIGGSFEHAFDIVRLGVMPQISMVVVSRETRAEALAGLCLGADLSGTVDLISGEEHHAFFLGLRLGAAYIFNEAPYWGGTAGLGYRY